MFFSKCSSTQWLPVQQHVSEEFSSEVNSTKNRSHPPKKTEMWLNYTILDMYIIYIYRDCVVSLKYNTVYPQRPRINHQPPISHLARGCTICIQGVEERSWGAFEGADVFFFFSGWLDMVGWWIRRKDVGYGWWFLDDGWWWRGCICYSLCFVFAGFLLLFFVDSFILLCFGCLEEGGREFKEKELEKMNIFFAQEGHSINRFKSCSIRL